MATCCCLDLIALPTGKTEEEVSIEKKEVAATWWQAVVYSIKLHCQVERLRWEFQLRGGGNLVATCCLLD